VEDQVVSRKLPSVRDHVSFSELSLFDECPWRWFLDVIEERRSKSDSIDLVFGDSMHKTLEFLKAVDVSSRPTPEIAKAKFSELFVLRAQQFPPRPNMTVESLVEAAGKIIDNIDTIPQFRDGKVVFNELQLLEQIDRSDGIAVKFKGFIDVGTVVPGRGKRGSKLWVCDYKTATWGWGGDKRFDAKVHRQLLLYKHFLCKKMQLDPTNVGCAFVILKKTPRGTDSPIEWFPISAGPKAVAAAVDHVQSTITAMNGGHYVARASACFKFRFNPCPYVGQCLCPVGEQATSKSV
jgi:hypothetical protein